MYDVDFPVDIEDLGSAESITTGSDAEEMFRAQWRASPWEKASKADIERACKLEDEVLAKHHIQIGARFKEEDDANAVSAEEHNISRSNAGGRIRRDDAEQVIQARRRRQSFDSKPSAKRLSYRPRLVVEGSAPRRRVSIEAKEKRDDLVSIFIDDDGNNDENGDPILASRNGDAFSNSTFVLSCEASDADDANTHSERTTVAIAEPLSKFLKPHQREAIEFLFRNSFYDFTYLDSHEAAKQKEKIGGCILAHNMGLGKVKKLLGDCRGQHFGFLTNAFCW